jgi:ribosome-associated protein
LTSKILDIVTSAIDERLGEDIVVLDFRNHSPFCDYFVIATALNNRMAKSIVDRIEEKMHDAKETIHSIEGNEDSNWQLIDCNEVVAHIFVGGERQIYQLERLWGDLPRVEVKL